MLRPSVCFLIVIGFSCGCMIGMNSDLITKSKAKTQAVKTVVEVQVESVPTPDFRQHIAKPLGIGKINPLVFGMVLFVGALAVLILFTKSEEIEKIRKEIGTK